jgi:Phosphate-selective porin O and P
MFSDFNFCSWLSSKPGTLYKDAGNPWISEFQVFGRFHYNAAYIDGRDVDGDKFNEAYTDVRRFRLGAKIGFLNYFTFKGAADMVDDPRFKTKKDNPEGGSIEWGYQQLDEATVTFDAQRAWGVSDLDTLGLIYGRFKWHGGLEARTSSNELLTVERSAISNKLYQSARPTGFAVNAVKGPINVTSGIYTSDNNDNIAYANTGNNVHELGSWQDGLMYNLEVIYTATNDLRFGYEFLYNDANKFNSAGVKQEDSLLKYKWAQTLSAEYAIGNGGINSEVFYGDNGGSELYKDADAARRGMFWATQITPYYWIVPAKLQAVAQYMYAGSENAQGIQTNSRYMRGDTGGNVNSGRGDCLNTYYVGLNYLVCGDNLKFQFGAQYEDLHTPGKGDGDANAWTYLFGFRTFF